ncbi:helix-turn-helix domain-containing protein [Salinibacter ruber]|jgi:transcriptional regulator with XRE-family HTH domain|uniref:helix-turn-helix domain-containing protein n=1 Tax=Salinibacter ruber TaxID=146919 RepID=UPI0016136F8C
MVFRDKVLGSLGSKIREERLEKSMSQEELSHRAGLDRSYVGGVERGERNVSAVNLVRIAVGIGVPLSSLFAEVDSEIKPYEYSDLPR